MALFLIAGNRNPIDIGRVERGIRSQSAHDTDSRYAGEGRIGIGDAARVDIGIRAKRSSKLSISTGHETADVRKGIGYAQVGSVIGRENGWIPLRVKDRLPDWVEVPRPTPSHCRVDRAFGGHVNASRVGQGQSIRNPCWGTAAAAQRCVIGVRAKVMQDGSAALLKVIIDNRSN